MNLNESIISIGQTDFENAIKYGKRSNEIAGYTAPSLTELSYEFLKFKLPEYINNCQFEELIIGLFRDLGHNVFDYEFNNVDIKDALYFLCYVTDEVRDINKLELEYLSNDPDTELTQAGVNELNILGESNLIDSLANGDILKYDSIVKLKYSRIFDKQLMTVIHSRIQKKLQEIRSRKK